nr:GrpB family protein [Vibrio alginolyticus]
MIKRLEELGVGLERFTVQLIDYVHTWSEAYDLIVSAIAPNLSGVAIYHIGSTAIPGSIAKPRVANRVQCPQTGLSCKWRQ